jgi:hypothetical protein
MPYRILRCTGFSPSRASGSARPTITLIAYDRYDVFASLASSTSMIFSSALPVAVAYVRVARRAVARVVRVVVGLKFEPIARLRQLLSRASRVVAPRARATSRAVVAIARHARATTDALEAPNDRALRVNMHRGAQCGVRARRGAP